MSVGQVTKATYDPETPDTIVLEGEWTEPEGYLGLKKEGHLFVTLVAGENQYASLHNVVPPSEGDPLTLIGRTARTNAHDDARTDGFAGRWRVEVECPWLAAARAERAGGHRYLARVVAVGILADDSLAVYDWEQWVLVTESRAG
jgi:hypothetical protein